MEIICMLELIILLWLSTTSAESRSLSDTLNGTKFIIVSKIDSLLTYEDDFDVLLSSNDSLENLFSKHKPTVKSLLLQNKFALDYSTKNLVFAAVGDALLRWGSITGCLLLDDLPVYGSVTSIVVDWINRNFYVGTHTTKVLLMVSLLDISKTKQRYKVLRRGDSIESVAVHPKTGYLFYCSWTEKTIVIFRTDLLGNNETRLHENEFATDMALDYKAERLYWVNFGRKTLVKSSNFSGGDIQVHAEFENIILSIDLFKDYIYVLGQDSLTILAKEGKTTVNEIKLKHTSGNKGRGILDLLVVDMDLYKDEETCDSTMCEEFCFRTMGPVQCACSDGLLLDDDKMNCSQIDFDFPDRGFLVVDSQEKNAIGLASYIKDTYEKQYLGFRWLAHYDSLSSTNATTTHNRVLLGTNVKQRTLYFFVKDRSTLHKRSIERQHDLDGVTILRQNMSCNAFTVDWVTSEIYWTDDHNKCIWTGIDKGNNLTMVRKLLCGEFFLGGITVDPIRRKLYWTDNRQEIVETSSLDGSKRSHFVNFTKSDNGKIVQVPVKLAMAFPMERVSSHRLPYKCLHTSTPHQENKEVGVCWMATGANSSFLQCTATNTFTTNSSRSLAVMGHGFTILEGRQAFTWQKGIKKINMLLDQEEQILKEDQPLELRDIATMNPEDQPFPPSLSTRSTKCSEVISKSGSTTSPVAVSVATSSTSGSTTERISSPRARSADGLSTSSTKRSEVVSKPDSTTSPATVSVHISSTPGSSIGRISSTKATSADGLSTSSSKRPEELPKSDSTTRPGVVAVPISSTSGSTKERTSSTKASPAYGVSTISTKHSVVMSKSDSTTSPAAPLVPISSTLVSTKGKINSTKATYADGLSISSSKRSEAVSKSSSTSRPVTNSVPISSTSGSTAETISSTKASLADGLSTSSTKQSEEVSKSDSSTNPAAPAVATGLNLGKIYSTKALSADGLSTSVTKRSEVVSNSGSTTGPSETPIPASSISRSTTQSISSTKTSYTNGLPTSSTRRLVVAPKSSSITTPAAASVYVSSTDGSVTQRTSSLKDTFDDGKMGVIFGIVGTLLGTLIASIIICVLVKKKNRQPVLLEGAQQKEIDAESKENNLVEVGDGNNKGRRTNEHEV